MSDNLFDRLFELLQSPGPVNWKLAAEVVASLAGEPEPIEPSLAEEYQELAQLADLRLAAATMLPSPALSEVHPTDRRTWARENLQTFRVLVEPLAERLAAPLTDAAPGPLGAALQPLVPALLGVQAGTMVGFMAHRVLGQFDTGIPAMDHDRPYLVVTNLEAFAVDHDLDTRQVRLWAALHELAFHRIMAVPWVRRRFVELVEGFYDALDLDPAGLVGALGDLDDPARLQELIGDAGDTPSLLRGKADPEHLAAIQAFTAFVEGFGDHTVHRAAADLLPDLARIEEAQARRRTEPDQAELFLQQLAGLSLQRRIAGEAAAFCEEVIRRWGDDALARVWEAPDRLPTRHELADPVGWAARVLLPELGPGEGTEDPNAS